MDCTRVGFATMVSRLPQVPSRSGWRRLGLRGIDGTGPTIALPPVGDADTALVRTVVSTARTVVTRIPPRSRVGSQKQQWQSCTMLSKWEGSSWEPPLELNFDSVHQDRCFIDGEP